MKTYINGNYLVIFNERNGTKIRTTAELELIPEFAESCDLKITNYCDLGCKFCYEGAGKEYKHPDLLRFPFIHTLRPYTELAINGNDLSHPQLVDFLRFLKDRKVFVSITVNQSHFMVPEKYELLGKLQAEKLIYGIGVSYVRYSEELISRMKGLSNTVLHTIAGILTKSDLEKLKDTGIKVLILGYKTVGRGVSYRENYGRTISENIGELKSVLPRIIKESWFDLVSFDNLSLDQLGVREIIPAEEWETGYMGDDGQFTFYIDLDSGKFAKNSMSPERYDIGDKTITEMFKFIKSIKK